MAQLLAARIPDDLAEDVQRMIDRVRSTPAPEEFRREGADLILRLTEACLESYFLAPVRSLEVGPFAEKATAVGVKTAHRAIALFVRRITGSLSGQQVLTLADQLEGMLFES